MQNNQAAENKKIQGETVLLLVLKNMVFFPKLMYFGLPILIFISLFFIPENYQGILPYSRTMQGIYQNKWLFDMLGFYGFIFFFLCITKYLLTGMPHNVNEKIVQNFYENVRGKTWFFNEQYILVIAYIGLVLAILMALTTTMHVAVPNRYMGFGTWNRNVFVNFFLMYAFLCVPRIIFLCFAIQYMVLNRDIGNNG